MPTFLIRRFHVSLAEIGVQYGTVVLIMGCLGVIVGPFLGRWLVARGHPDYNIRIPVFACLGLVPFAAVLPLAPTYGVALILYAGLTFCCSSPLPLGAAALHPSRPPRIPGDEPPT